jgi:hypothetical protein
MSGATTSTVSRNIFVVKEKKNSNGGELLRASLNHPLTVIGRKSTSAITFCSRTIKEIIFAMGKGKKKIFCVGITVFRVGFLVRLLRTQLCLFLSCCSSWL